MNEKFSNYKNFSVIISIISDNLLGLIVNFVTPSNLNLRKYDFFYSKIIFDCFLFKNSKMIFFKKNILTPKISTQPPFNGTFVLSIIFKGSPTVQPTKRSTIFQTIDFFLTSTPNLQSLSLNPAHDKTSPAYLKNQAAKKEKSIHFV